METREDKYEYGRDSYAGKFWSNAVHLAFSAPFPEVAVQYLLTKVHQKARIEVLEELLGRKWEAYQEREALFASPDGAVSIAQAEGVDAPVMLNERRLQYVKVWDIEQMLKKEKEEHERTKTKKP